MHPFFTKVAAVAALFGSLSLAIQEASAAAMPVGNLAPAAAESLPVQDTQYFFGGRNYCFYPDGWHGPGWYWCGYAFRRGFGWGGGSGWNGWGGGGGHRGGGFRGGFHGGGHGGGHGGHGGGHGGHH
jgi:hypothetical protein